MMFVAQLIRPSFLEIKLEDISCDLCNIKYSVSDYKALFLAKKLCFFYLPEEVITEDIGIEIITCHGCLMDYLWKISDQNDINLIIIDEEEDFKLTFPYHELRDFPQYFDFSFLHGDNSEGDEEDEEDDENDLDGYDGFLPPPDL